MRIGIQHVLAAAILIGGAGAVFAKTTHDVSSKAPLTLDNTRWKVRASGARKTAEAKARSFSDELTFRKGAMSNSAALEKQGFQLTPYFSEKPKGTKNTLQWNCEQTNSIGDKLLWQATALRRKSGTWKMTGTLTRTSPDGKTYKFSLRGSGRVLPPEPPSTPSDERALPQL